MRRRAPAVAGYFYPSGESELRKMLALLVHPDEPKIPAVGVVCPHAGYVYSGRTAGRVYSKVHIPRRVLILGPNHTGMGAPLSCWARGEWQTPLGVVPVDEDIARRLLEACPYLEDDEQAHLREHAIEVQLPFIQYLVDTFSFVPIVVGTNDMTALTALAQAVATVVRDTPEPVLLVASTDMSHYIPARDAAELDQHAIRAIAAVDGPALYRVVHTYRISMCGYLPTTVVLMAARELGAVRGELVEYTHSGVVTGDDHSVVAYLGMILRGANESLDAPASGHRGHG